MSEQAASRSSTTHYRTLRSALSRKLTSFSEAADAAAGVGAAANSALAAAAQRALFDSWKTGQGGGNKVT